MQARPERRAMTIQLLCGGVSSHHGDSSYVGSSLTADRQQELLEVFLTADESKMNPKQVLRCHFCRFCRLFVIVHLRRRRRLCCPFMLFTNSLD